MHRPRAPWPSLVASVAALAAHLAAPAALAVPAPRPTGPSPVAFTVEPVAGTARWRWTLRNVTDHPVEVAADRRLVWLEVPPPAPLPGARRRRPARAPRCVHDARPATPDRAVRTVLAPGQRYSELVDLRDTCRLRVPAALVEGASAVAHYGFAPLPARGVSLARWRARTVVFDEIPYPVNDLTAAVTVPAMAPPPSPPAPVPAGLRVEARDAQAAYGEALVATVALRNPGRRPLRTYYRTTQFGFELETPSGRAVRCDLLARDANAFREFFVRLGAGGRRGARLVVADFCPAGALDEAGLYQARASFESRADGDPWFTDAFVGRALSAPFVLRIARGRARYRPFGLVISD
ncbi:MAG: hypothetical protein U0324_32460 [Polyangiales bacterium]